MGASLAGLRAVEELRRGGFDGGLTLVGAENHPPYNRPPLSKKLLAGNLQTDAVFFRGTNTTAYKDLRLNLRLGCKASSLDLHSRQVILGDGERVDFDGLIIATGARPRPLPHTNGLRGVHTLRTLEDCLAIRQAVALRPKVVVIGGGFIGGEVAATLRTHALDVTLVETMPVPLCRTLGSDIGAACMHIQREHGVVVRTGVGVRGLEGVGRIERVRLADGTAISADLVVVGIGVSPETAWLEDSGLALSDGVICDATCAASAPGVYVAGDVARWHNPLFGQDMRVEHWTNAAEQGAAAARALLAGPGNAAAFASIPFFWSDQYDVTIQHVGWSGPAATMKVVHGKLEDRRFVAIYGHAGRVVGVVGFNWPRLVMSYRKLIAERVSWDQALAQAATING